MPGADGQTRTGDPFVAANKRALLVKFGSIGDVIMAIPAAADLRRQGFCIDWVASESVAPLLELYPWIRVLRVDEPQLLRGSPVRRVSTWMGLRRRLRAEVRRHGPYHTVATLYYDRRYRWLTSLLRAKRRVSLSRNDRRWALLPGRHHTDEYARILSDRVDGEAPFQLAPVPPPSLPLSPHPRAPGKPRVVLVPAGARNLLRDDALRRWPMDDYVALSESLIGAGCEVVLAGGPDDGWASPHFRRVAERSADTEFADLIGKLSLVQTLGLLHSAEVTVTHDTGPLHMAGLTATAIVTIFGPTDPHGRLPRRENSVALWGGEGFGCRPCYDGRDYAPCAHNGCMAQIRPEEVLREVRELLEARGQGRVLPPRVKLPEPTPFVQIGAGGRQ